MKLKTFVLIFTLLAPLTGAFAATQLFSDSFESYKRGRLDVNDPTGPNTNSANPWAGPFAADANNCFVVGSETSNGILVSPHTGTNMVRGSGTPDDFDQDYYNLGFWLNTNNAGAAFTGNIYLDWWFFDQVGSGTNGTDPSTYADFIALAYYNGIPTNKSYDPNLANNPLPYPPPARLGIGGAFTEDGSYDGTNLASGFSKTNYQALIFSPNSTSTNGYDSTGSANLPVARSVGWHHARIEVGALNSDLSNTIKYYIDDLVNPAKTVNYTSANGYNCIELNGNFNNVAAHYDDITFGTIAVVRPTLSIASAGTNCIVTWAGSHILQSATVVAGTNFTDVLSGTNFVTSPYTNNASGTARFFRLRN